MNKVITLHKITLLLIKRAKEKKMYPLDFFLAQYGLKTPLVSVVGFCLFLTFKVFIWGVSCENPIFLNKVQVPDLVLSMSGTLIALVYVDLFMKRFLYPNLYDILSLLPLNSIQKLFLKYSTEILGYRLIYIIIDLITLSIFIYTYFPNLSLINIVLYLGIVMLTHYLTFGCYSLVFNYIIKMLNFSAKTVSTLNNFFLVVLFVLMMSLILYNKQVLGFSISTICIICSIFIVLSFTFCLFLECFLDKNLYNDDNN